MIKKISSAIENSILELKEVSYGIYIYTFFKNKCLISFYKFFLKK